MKPFVVFGGIAKKLFKIKNLLPLLLFVLVATAGCATRYSLILTNGDVLTSRGKPKFDSARGIYIYKDYSGNTNAIFAGKVREIAPASMADKGSSQFFKQ